MLADDLDGLTADQDRKRALGAIADMLDKNGIDFKSIGKIRHAGVHRVVIKNADGEAEYHDSPVISFSPSWEDGPAWPVVKPGPVVKLPKPLPAKRPSNGWPTCVVLPDIQCGYFRGAGEQLEAIHDEAALTVALALVKDIRPDLIVLVGDNADFCEFGKYVVTASYQRTTQATIDRLTVLCAELRDAAPDARIVWLAGNHEERLPRFIQQNAAAAFGLRRGNIPDAWPVLSVPYLCRFDDYGIEYLPGYPASHFWINDNLKVIHGDKVASGGSTAHKYLGTEKVSVIYGHIHRREYAARTRDDRDGPKMIMAASPGCLARIDGVVPSTKGGTDLDGRPIQRTEDWQQAIAVVQYETDGRHRFTYEMVAIQDGWALRNGKEYAA